MEHLYRKITLPSGRVRYHETHRWDQGGDPADGIWYVEKKKHGMSYHWITKKLSDLPRAMKLAELEPYRDMICKKMSESGDRYISSSDLVSEIFAEIVDTDV